MRAKLGSTSIVSLISLSKRCSFCSRTDIL